MTLRAVLLGLLGAAAVCGFGFFNDQVMRQTYLVGNYMPISVYGGLIVFLLLVNPVLVRCRRGLALSRRELAVVVALILPACYVPGRGLMHYFTTTLMMPRHHERREPGWREYGVVKLAPEAMLASVTPLLHWDDVLDAHGLCARLVNEGTAGTPGPLRRVWELLPERDRQMVRDCRAPVGQAGGRTGDEAPAAKETERTSQAAVARVLSGILTRPDFHDEADFAGVKLRKEAEALLDRLPATRAAAAGASEPLAPSEDGAAPLNDDEMLRLNRRLLDAACPRELRDIDASEEHVINGFLRGLRVGEKHIDFFSTIPWYAWGRTLLLFWLPLLLAISFALIGLALVVHRQWSDHEQMPYPIIEFASSLLPEEGEAKGVVFTNRLFLIGAASVLFIHLNNYAYEWWPQYLARIPTYFDFTSLSQFIPALRRGGDWAIMNPTIYFTAVGFAYFVATDVSLSLGIAPFVFAIVAGTFAGHGISFFEGDFISLKIESFLFGGAYFGMFLVLAYTGRRYYAAVFRRGLFLPAHDDVEPAAVWGARVFMVGAALFAARLVLVGLAWQWAILYTAGAVMIFLVISRIVAETGLFFIHSYWFPGVMLWGFLGARALGPRAMLIMFLVSAVLLVDPREALMPFVVHGLKLADRNGVRVGRTAGLSAVALVLGLAIALMVTLYLQYDRGAEATGDGWTIWGPPRFPFVATLTAQQKLGAQGVLDQAGDLTGRAWLASIVPNTRCVVAFGVTMALVLAFAAARLRFARWPLHPVMFLTLGSWQSRCLAVSFLIGWFIKVMVSKYGGVAGYRRLKPFMIGIIAGDMLGGIFPMAVGAIYYFWTGQVPKGFRIMPG